MEKEFLYHGKFSINLKHLPPIDPSIITEAKHEKPTTKNVFKVAKPSPEEETSLVKIGEAATKADLTDNLKKKSLKIEEDDSFCSSKYIDPISTETSSKDKKKGATNITSAKSQLHEICAANKWNPPVFECCKEEGLCHSKLFTFKVIVEIDEASNTVLECFGSPQSKKKTAAEHAAEGALWYLKHLGYLPIDE